MSEVNILADDNVCPFKVIISQESSAHSDAEINNGSDNSESDPCFHGYGMDSELSVSSDNAYTLRYNKDYSGILLPNEWSDHLMNVQTKGTWLHKENSMLKDQLISQRIHLRCSHIIIKHMHSETPSSWRKRKIEITRKEALKKIMRIRRLIRSGKVGFDKMARICSDCCSARRNGDLGTFHPGQTWPEFERIVMSLRINELSQIFETQAGFHIVLRTQPRSPTEIRRSKVVIANEKVKAGKHIRKEHTGIKAKLKIKGSKQCQNFEELYGEEKAHTEDDFDRKPWEMSQHKIFVTIEEENEVKLKFYEEQEQQIMESFVDHTLTEKISKLIIKSSSDDKATENDSLEVKTSDLKGSEKDEKQTFIIKHAKHAVDLFRCYDAKTLVLIPRHFLVGPIGLSPCVTVPGSERSPSEWDLEEHQYEKWKPPNCERETECVWKRKSLLNMTPSNSDV